MNAFHKHFLLTLRQALLQGWGHRGHQIDLARPCIRDPGSQSISHPENLLEHRSLGAILPPSTPTPSF